MSKGENVMKFAQACLIAGVASGIPLAASAQPATADPADIKYCTALGRAYANLWPAMEAMPAAVAVTMDRCQRDTRAATLALEGKLKDKRIELPPHEAIAAQPGPSARTR
jgi:hypothetical protein